MHTYRTASKAGKSGFQVGTASGAGGQGFEAVGPVCETEAEAAALASFMNGGRYEPDAVTDVFKPAEEERQKAKKDREEAAKREVEVEKERAQAAAEAERKAREPAPEPDKPEQPHPAAKPEPKARAHASTAKRHVKHAKVRITSNRHK